MFLGYARVSTGDQKLDLQNDALIKSGCERIFTDTAGGASAERAGLEQALAFARKGDTIVVWKLDRLGRSLRHLVETLAALRDRGIGFRSLQESIDTTTSGGKLVFHVFAALAEFERDLIRKRTRAGLDAARARGKRGGRLSVTLTHAEIDRCLSEPDFTSRTRAMVSLVIERLSVLADKDPQPDVVVCAMPKDVEDACGRGARDNRIRKIITPQALKAEYRRKEQDAKSGQLSLAFDGPETAAPEPTPSHLFRDFHNALKANAMRAKLPTQLVWEGTLRNARDTEDPATTAWNFFTALYYKAGNMPWELQFGVPRTCFVGITFYRESPDPNSPTRTCLAQAFSESGEGLVLRGERVTWDKERDKKPHLNERDAESILRKVIELYRFHFNGPPHRVVVHKTSRYWPEELRGFKAALGDIHSSDFLALERRGIRFMRLGSQPPVRGTVIELGKRNYLVYTRGYIPFLRTYPGMRIPNPLEVVEHLGDSSAEKVCTELLALTKLNWNTCAFASADPVTIAFSRQVATIIKELPEGVELLTKYRHFM